MMFKYDKNRIAIVIKKYRKKHGYTQAQLAELADMNEQHISKLENATHTPSLETFLILLDILQIDLTDIGISKQHCDNQEKNKLISKILNASDKDVSFYVKHIKYIEDILKNCK